MPSPSRPLSRPPPISPFWPLAPQGTSHTPGATIRSHCSDDALADDARRFQHIDPIQLIIVAQAYQRMLHDDLRSDLPCLALPCRKIAILQQGQFRTSDSLANCERTGFRCLKPKKSVDMGSGGLDNFRPAAEVGMQKVRKLPRGIRHHISALSAQLLAYIWQ